MTWKDGWKASIIGSQEVKEKWPRMLMDFLESRINFFIPPNPTIILVDFALSEGNAVGNPKKVHCKFMMFSFHQTTLIDFPHHINSIYVYSLLDLDVSNVGRQINYWVEFQNGNCRFLTSDEMKTDWPLLAIAYLEENLTFN